MPASVPGLRVLALIRESAYDGRVGLVRVAAEFVQPVPAPSQREDRVLMYQMYCTIGIQKR